MVLRKYFITIAKHQVKDHVSKIDLMLIIHELKLRYPTLESHNMVYELSPTYRQLHCHFIAYTTEFIRYSDIKSINGYSIRVKPIYNLAKVCRYLRKQVVNKYEQEQLLIINDAQRYNLFI